MISPFSLAHYFLCHRISLITTEFSILLLYNCISHTYHSGQHHYFHAVAPPDLTILYNSNHWATVPSAASESNQPSQLLDVGQKQTIQSELRKQPTWVSCWTWVKNSQLNVVEVMTLNLCFASIAGSMMGIHIIWSNCHLKRNSGVQEFGYIVVLVTLGGWENIYI